MLDIDLSSTTENVKTITSAKIDKCPKCNSLKYDIQTIDSSILGNCLQCGNRFFLGMFAPLLTMTPKETEDYMKLADAEKEFSDWSAYEY